MLVVQLTDPPQVPVGTSSLNLTYSAVNLLVSEPASHGQVTTSSVSVTPSGGSATVDLLHLQNVSETIASASLPTGSSIYAIGFTVKSIAIDINGTAYPVSLAAGGTALGATLAHPASLDGNADVLLELNPVVADTPTGYQLIPSLVGVLKPQSEYQQGDQDVGTKDKVSHNDQQDLDQASGQITSRLVSLSVSGNITTFVVQVNNTGTAPVSLIALGLHGNFTSQDGCPGKSDDHDHGNGGDHGSNRGHMCDQHNEVVFSPVLSPETTTTTTSLTSSTTSSSTSTTSSTTLTTSSSTTATTLTSRTTTIASSCTTGLLALQGSQGDDEGDQGGLTIAPGECLVLTFSGPITFGNSSPVVPTTVAGQVFTVHVIASENAEIKMDCTLPLKVDSCVVPTMGGNQHGPDW